MNKLLLLIVSLLISFVLKAQTDLIISEYVEGWSTNKAIEIFNPTATAINLKDYQLVRYANGEDIPPAADDWKVVLPDAVLEPYKTFVCVIDKRNPEGTGQEAPIWKQLEVRADAFLCANYAISNTLYHNGDDAIALEKTNGKLVDLFARWGEPRPAEAIIGGSALKARCWTDTAPYFNGTGAGITADHTLVRKASVVTGVIVNPTLFNPLEQWDSLSANTFDHLGWHKSNVSPANQTPVFSQESYTFKVWKQATNGAKLGKAIATDTESDKLKFYINSGNFIYNDNKTEDAADDVRLTPFQINKETGELTVADASSFQYSKNDTVYMSISVNDGFSETNWITVIAVLSESQVGKETVKTGQFSIYPNPVLDQVNLVSEKQMKTVSVMNVAGQMLIQKEVTGNKASINLAEITTGVYFIEAQFNDGSKELQRMVKK